MSRKFDGEIVPLSELRERFRKDNPKATDEEIEKLAREKRNFNNKHLRAYIKGHQIFHFGRDNYKRPQPNVV